MTPRTPPRRRNTERGSGLIENLFALGLLGITIMGSVNLHVYTLHANSANQNFSTLTEEVQALVDGYRSQGLNALLGKFGIPRASIAHGATAVETVDSVSPTIGYTVTFTALNATSGSAPQAVRVTIVATQDRGTLGSTEFRYETVIAQIA